MKKFFILFLVLVFVLFSFTGCKRNTALEADVTEIPENGIVVTVDPLQETNEAEEILSELATDVPALK